VGITPHLFFLQRYLSSGNLSLHEMSKLVLQNESKIQKEEDDKNKNVHVVWGCRYKDKDYIVKDLFKYFSNTCTNLKIRVTFSRETEDKKYVQHLIEHHAKEYGEFIINNFENIEIYVCGSSKFLPKSLDKAFKKCFLTVLGNDKQKEAEEILNKLYQNEAIKYESFA
jgi:sulfite reductase alpha subunit-like flavoprotein